MRKLAIFTLIVPLILIGNNFVFASTISFYVYDRPSYSVTLTDSSANIVSEYKYDAFGNIKSQNEVSQNNFKYVGEQYDQETDLIYLRSRYYSSNLGRFISKDPHSGFDNVPQTRNPYPYCTNNPTNFIDPSGEVVPLIVAGLIVAAAVGWYAEAMDALNEGGDYADINNAGAIGAISKDVGLIVGATTKNPFLGGVAGSATSSFLDQWILGGDVNFSNAAVSALESGVASWVTAGIIKEAIPLNAPGWLNIFSAKDLSITTGLDSVRYVAGSELSPLISTGIKFGINSLVSDFGGVSLSTTANLMLNIDDIAGATYDEATGQVIFFGKEDAALPQMDLDDLAVAINSVYKKGEDPGVSIGTEASDRSGYMKVRYDGATAGTEFGEGMFESDRQLKILSLGKDNETGQTVTSGVAGYKNMLDRYKEAGGSSFPEGESSDRMWFVPKEIVLSKSADDNEFAVENSSPSMGEVRWGWGVAYAQPNINLIIPKGIQQPLFMMPMY